MLVLPPANPGFAEEWKSAAPILKGAEEVYGIAAGGKLYVFGGLGLDWKAMGMVMEYDPDTDRWTRKRDMPQYLHHVALAEAGGRIYMFGGFTLPEKGKAMWVPSIKHGNTIQKLTSGRRLLRFPSRADPPTPFT
jgi:hypothetical protein